MPTSRTSSSAKAEILNEVEASTAWDQPQPKTLDTKVTDMTTASPEQLNTTKTGAERYVQTSWQQVLESDPLKYSDVDVKSAPQPDDWLLENPGAWLYETRRPSTHTSAARVVLVTGEAGCGKSTTMRLISLDLQKAGRLPIFIDFGHVPTVQGRNFSEQELTESLNSHISNQVRTSAEKYGLSSAYEAQLVRTVFAEVRTPEVEELRQKNSGIVDWPDETLSACVEALKLAKVCEKREYEQFLALTAVQLFVPGAPPVLILDNLEGLPAVARKILIGKLTAVLRPRTALFMAIRSENRSEADILLQDRNDEVFPLEDVDESLLDIALIRNNGARDYVLARSIDAAVDPIEAGELAAVQHAAFERAVTNLRGDDFSFAMANNWLNSNVRNFLGLMSSLSRNLPADDGLAEMRAWLSTTLFRTRTHKSLLKIFDQAHYSCSKYDLPFVFLPLRILFYIHTRGGSASVIELRDDFVNQFGILPKDIADALKSFTEKQAGHPQPLRIYTDSDGASHVILLKCGEVFVNDALYRFDFLATLFDRVEDNDLHRKYSRLATGQVRMPDSKLKLLKGAAVIEHLVLPALSLEHPYMEVPRLLTQEESRRLRSYDVMFRFRLGRWFIGSLRSALEEFATPRGYLSDVSGTINLLERYESALNAAALGKGGE